MGKRSHKTERRARLVVADVVEAVLEATVVELIAFGWPVDDAVDRVNRLWEAYGPGSTSPADFMLPFRVEVERLRSTPPE